MKSHSEYEVNKPRRNSIHDEGNGRFKPIHGLTDSPTYRSWSSMMTRCNNKKCHAYQSYGGRGIKVHHEWYSFETFIKDVGIRPGLEFSIERINNDGNYEPGNVRWADKNTQANNTRKSVRFTHNGKTQTSLEWAKEAGINPSTMRTRLWGLGWDISKAVTQPVR